MQTQSQELLGKWLDLTDSIELWLVDDIGLHFAHTEAQTDTDLIAAASLLGHDIEHPIINTHTHDAGYDYHIFDTTDITEAQDFLVASGFNITKTVLAPVIPQEPPSAKPLKVDHVPMLADAPQAQEETPTAIEEPLAVLVAPEDEPITSLPNSTRKRLIAGLTVLGILGTAFLVNQFSSASSPSEPSLEAAIETISTETPAPDNSADDALPSEPPFPIPPTREIADTLVKPPTEIVTEIAIVESVNETTIEPVVEIEQEPAANSLNLLDQSLVAPTAEDLMLAFGEQPVPEATPEEIMPVFPPINFTTRARPDNHTDHTEALIAAMPKFVRSAPPFATPSRPTDHSKVVAVALAPPPPTPKPATQVAASTPTPKPAPEVIPELMSPAPTKTIEQTFDDATEAQPIRTAVTTARMATIENGIGLRNLALIGVFGNANRPSALVRSSAGRVYKVKVGDNVEGWRVEAISSNRLIMRKGSKQETLSIAKG